MKKSGINIRKNFSNRFLQYGFCAMSAAMILSSCEPAADLVSAPGTEAQAEILARRNKPATTAPDPSTTTNPQPSTLTPTTTTNTTAVNAEAAPTPGYTRAINFSGYTWNVRSNTSYSGPGLNLFSNTQDNVWIDSQGQLHLKITYMNGKWQAAEILSQKTFGYGEYRFYLSSQAEKIDKNAVFGLFTWNNNSFQTDANSEIDIEFAKWGQDNIPSLLYSVQPTNWSAYRDRCSSPTGYSTTGDYSTHGFKWTPQDVKFNSYHDHGYPTSWLAGAWAFLPTAPRSKTEGGRVSDPVLVPKPGTGTHVHMNLWLHDANNDGYGDAPSNGQVVEVIVKKFEFIPYTTA